MVVPSRSSRAPSRNLGTDETAFSHVSLAGLTDGYESRMDRKSVFISHTGEEVARDLQAVLMHAFPDQIKPFNSAEAQQGLSSGVKIEDAILDSIERAELFISLWTPDSLESPAWMA